MRADVVPEQLGLFAQSLRTCCVESAIGLFPGTGAPILTLGQEVLSEIESKGAPDEGHHFFYRPVARQSAIERFETVLVANDDFLSQSSRLIHKQSERSSFNQGWHRKALFLTIHGATESPVGPNGFAV